MYKILDLLEKQLGRLVLKAAQYKLVMIWNKKGLGGVGIFLAKKWVD